MTPYPTQFMTITPESPQHHPAQHPLHSLIRCYSSASLESFSSGDALRPKRCLTVPKSLDARDVPDDDDELAALHTLLRRRPVLLGRTSDGRVASAWEPVGVSLTGEGTVSRRKKKSAWTMSGMGKE
jgi:hypothetical protein